MQKLLIFALICVTFITTNQAKPCGSCGEYAQSSGNYGGYDISIHYDNNHGGGYDRGNLGGGGGHSGGYGRRHGHGHGRGNGGRHGGGYGGDHRRHRVEQEWSDESDDYDCDGCTVNQVGNGYGNHNKVNVYE